MAEQAGSGLLAKVMRGKQVESRPLGRAVVVDADGSVVWSCGDVEKAVFPRSTVKSLLAIELVESEAADRLGLSDEALAFACASHNGEEAPANRSGWLFNANICSASEGSCPWFCPVWELCRPFS